MQKTVYVKQKGGNQLTIKYNLLSYQRLSFFGEWDFFYIQQGIESPTLSFFDGVLLILEVISLCVWVL